MASKENNYMEGRKAIIVGENFTNLLSPITDEIPSLLLPICGIPYIEYIIDWLSSFNVKEMIFCYKNNKDQLEKYLKKHHKQNYIKLIHSEDFNSLGDCLRKVESEKLVSTDFILISGLVVSNIDLDKIYSMHLSNKKQDKNCVITSIFKSLGNEDQIRTDYDDNLIIYDENTKRIYQYESIFEKNKIKLNENVSFKPNKNSIPKYRVRSDLYDSLISICSPEILNIFTENFLYHYLREDYFKNTLVSEIYTDTHYLYELTQNDYIGLIRNPESYLKISFEILNRWAYPTLIENISTSRKLNLNYYLIDFSIYNEKENNEDNFSKAHLINSVILSKNCKVGENSKLKYTSVNNDVTIGKNCNINNCIIFHNCKIGNNVTLSNSIICSNSTVENDIKIKNSLIGKNIIQSTNSEDERICNVVDLDTEEKTVERTNKEMFYKNLEDREVLFLVKKKEEEENESSENQENEEEEEEEEEEDDDNQSNKNSDEGDEEDYEVELIKVINTHLEKGESVNDVMKEIQSFKNAFWEKTYAETLKACLSAILKKFMNGENFNHNHIELLKKLFIEWSNLFKRLVINEEVEIQLISVFEKLCMDISEISDAFHIIIQVLNSNELNVIKDKSILAWKEKEESEYNTSDGNIVIPKEIHTEYLKKMEKYIDSIITN